MAFKQIFELSDGSFASRGLSVPEFMDVVDDFLQHLTFHHGIEEQCASPSPFPLSLAMLTLTLVLGFVPSQGTSFQF